MKSKEIDSFRKEFMNVLGKFNQSKNPSEIWRDFIVLSACCISNSIMGADNEREKLYLRIIKRYSESDSNLFPKLLAILVLALEENPEQDFLGEIFQSELKMGNVRTGQFFTPYNISRFIAEVECGNIESEIEKAGYISANDPTCGSGGMLIAFANAAKNRGINYQQSVLFVAQDIDFVVAMMCYIQLSLLGCAGYVIVGNSLTNTNPEEDDIWYTPFYFNDIWKTRRFNESLKRKGLKGA